MLGRQIKGWTARVMAEWGFFIQISYTFMIVLKVKIVNFGKFQRWSLGLQPYKHSRPKDIDLEMYCLSNISMENRNQSEELILPPKRPLYMRNIVKVALKSGIINLSTLIINLYPYWSMY